MTKEVSAPSRYRSRKDLLIDLKGFLVYML